MTALDVWRAAPAATKTARATEVLLAVAGTTAGVGVVASNSLVILAGCGIVLAVLVVVRFEMFLLGALVARAALDQYRADSTLAPGTALGAVVLAIVFVIEALAWLKGRRARALNAPFRLPLQVLLGASVISALGSNDIAGSGVESLRLAGVLAMVLALERTLVTLAAARRVLLAFFLSALIPTAVAGFQAARGEGRLIGGLSRITGTFDHPNPFSIYLALVIVMAFALIPHVNGAGRWALACGVLVASGCLLLTYTRGSWIALIAGLLVVGMLQSKRLLLVMLGGIVVAVLVVPSIGQRFADLQAPVQYSGATSNSLVWRVGYWQEAIKLSEDSPVIGIGLKGISRSTQDAKDAHNDLVRTYVETGLVGLLAYLALAASLVATARRALRVKVKGWQRGAAVGFAGTVMTIAVVSLTSNVITQVVLLWYVVALGMVAVAVSGLTEPQTGPVVSESSERDLARSELIT